MAKWTRRDVLRTGVAVSASALFNSPTLARVNDELSGHPSESTRPPDISARERVLFDFDWKFLQGHADDAARDLGFGKSQDAFSKSGTFDFAKCEFDDSKWRTLDLPHDWAVELPFVHDELLQGHGYKPVGRNYPETSVGWYRRQFETAQTDHDRRIAVEFDGAFRSALVFVNGYFIGRNDNGYLPFRFDVTDFLNYGGKNCIAVRMDASFGDGWFYEGAGIYRHVWLLKTDAVHLDRWESYVRTDVKDDASATVELGTMVRNEGRNSQTCRVHWEIIDPSGQTVASADSAKLNLGADGSFAATASAVIHHPKLWSVDHPDLYAAVVSVDSDGKRCDGEQIAFGVRTLRFDVKKGFFLNGRAVKIK